MCAYFIPHSRVQCPVKCVNTVFLFDVGIHVTLPHILTHTHTHVLFGFEGHYQLLLQVIAHIDVYAYSPVAENR